MLQTLKIKIIDIMPKRTHIKKLDIQPRFYAPLMSDYKDAISGVSASVIDSVGDFDNVKGLRFNGNGGLCFSNTLFSWLGYNQSFTLLIDFYILTQDTEYTKLAFFSPNTNADPYEKGLSYSDGTLGGYYYNAAYYDMDNGTYQQVGGMTGRQKNVQYNKFGMVYDGNTHIFHPIEEGVILSSSASCLGWTNGYTYLYVGQSQRNIGRFNGYIKNIMVFDKTLTPQEIATL